MLFSGAIFSSCIAEIITMKKIIGLYLFLLPIALTAQDVMKLSSVAERGKGSVAQLSWLAGYWVGTGLGGQCEELWMPANDSSMHGVFRFAEKGSLQFTEYMVIEQDGKSLMLRLKHFGGGVQPWEEKEKWIEFPLVKLEGQTAWFDGLTYSRKNQELIVKLHMKSGNTIRVEEFIFRKSEL
jgi:hypothetical protein